MNLTTRLEVQLLRYGNRVLDVAANIENPTFRELLDIDDLLTAIEQDILELIGEDILTKDGSPVNHTMQKYRTELRTKLHKYIKGDE